MLENMIHTGEKSFFKIQNKMGNFLTLYRRVSCVSVRDSVTRCLTFVQELLLAGDGGVAARLSGPVAAGVEHTAHPHILTLYVTKFSTISLYLTMFYII